MLDFICKDTDTLVLFDMDGVLAEYKWGENDLIRAGDVAVYSQKRPIESVIATAKELLDSGVQVGILSSCCTLAQRDAKIEWLAKYAPFIKDNLHILVWEQLNLSRDERSYAKGKYMQSLNGYKYIYLIDDKHDVIQCTNEIIPYSAHHISEIVR